MPLKKKNKQQNSKGYICISGLSGTLYGVSIPALHAYWKAALQAELFHSAAGEVCGVLRDLSAQRLSCCHLEGEQ